MTFHFAATFQIDLKVCVSCELVTSKVVYHHLKLVCTLVSFPTQGAFYYDLHELEVVCFQEEQPAWVAQVVVIVPEQGAALAKHALKIVFQQLCSQAV